MNDKIIFKKTKEEIAMQNKQEKGITLISLVITIIVLLILARSNNSNANRRQWNNRKSTERQNSKQNYRQ